MLTEIANIYKALSNLTRLKIIFFILEHPNGVGVNSIAEATALKQPVVSKQLGILYHYQIVSREKLGINVFYRVDDPHIVEILTDMRNHVAHEIRGAMNPKDD